MEPLALSFVHLNMLRGIAALLVLLTHLRLFVFVSKSYRELANPGPIDIILSILTGFSHQAVLIFFVLSGFLITRSIVLDEKRGIFAWTRYFIKRMTRLWVVLVPCLVLTFLWDRLGIHYSGSSFYEGLLQAQYISGPQPETNGIDLTLSAFIKNLFFLQTIVGPTFGSNAPLWSLAYEFWYYLMFPLFYISIVHARSWIRAAICFVIIIAICLFVGESIILYGFIWLAGAAAYLVYDRDWFAIALHSLWALGSTFLAFIAALAVSRFPLPDFTRDLLVGVTGASLVLVLSKYEGGGALYRRCARSLADASYTIYLAHFPFLAFLANVVLRHQQFANSTAGYAVFIGVGAVTLIYCYAVYWVFERRTDAVRLYFLAKSSIQLGTAHKA